MELNLKYEQDFTKKGKLSKFGGTDYGIKGPKDEKSYQLDRLRSELSKYNILESRVYSIAETLYRMNSVEYMNMKYLAAVVVMLENLELEYKSEEEFDELARYVFEDKEFLKPYLEKIVDVDREKDPKYMRLVKTTLLTYMYKLWFNRYNNFTFSE